MELYTMAEILRDQTQLVIERKGLKRPAVILVDHGTPAREVNAVRNALVDPLRELLGEKIYCLRAASMESREGDEYAFNKPLLAELLSTQGFNTGDVVIALLFCCREDMLVKMAISPRFVPQRNGVILNYVLTVLLSWVNIRS